MKSSSLCLNLARLHFGQVQSMHICIEVPLFYSTLFGANFNSVADLSMSLNSRKVHQYHAGFRKLYTSLGLANP